MRAGAEGGENQCYHKARTAALLDRTAIGAGFERNGSGYECRGMLLRNLEIKSEYCGSQAIHLQNPPQSNIKLCCHASTGKRRGMGEICRSSRGAEVMRERVIRGIPEQDLAVLERKLQRMLRNIRFSPTR